MSLSDESWRMTGVGRCEVGSELTVALRAIKESGLTGQLARAAVFIAMQQGKASQPRDGGHAAALEGMEAALLAVARASGLGKPTLTVAKEWLRRHGQPGQALASRLGRLSKARNVAAHPDLSLTLDIECLAAGTSEASDASSGAGPVLFDIYEVGEFASTGREADPEQSSSASVALEARVRLLEEGFEAARLDTAARFALLQVGVCHVGLMEEVPSPSPEQGCDGDRLDGQTTAADEAAGGFQAKEHAHEQALVGDDGGGQVGGGGSSPEHGTSSQLASPPPPRAPSMGRVQQ
jgi:hypothetical protein